MFCLQLKTFTKHYMNTIIILLIILNSGFAGWCGFTNWSGWSGCSQTCAGGYRLRNRSRTCSPNCGSALCEGNSEQMEDERCGTCLNGGYSQDGTERKGPCYCVCGDSNWGQCCENVCEPSTNCAQQHCDSPGPNSVCKMCTNSTSRWTAACPTKTNPYDSCSTCSSIDDADDAYCLKDGQCEARCNWLGHICWPGTCMKPEYLSSSCQCSQGFILSGNGQTTSCVLTQKPVINTCTLSVTSADGRTLNNQQAAQTFDCANPDPFYLNSKPNSISYNFEFSHIFGENPDTINPRHSYIHDYAFGVIMARITMKQFTTTGSVNTLVQTTNIASHADCNIKTFTKDTPVSSLISCGYTGNFPWAVDAALKFCFHLDVTASGFVRVMDLFNGRTISPVQYYNSTTTSSEICFITDMTPPMHCFAGMDSSKCTYMIDVGSRIRSSTQLTVSAKDWFDPDTMSDTVQPSGIGRYTMVIYDTMVENEFITVDKSAPVISEITSSTYQFSVLLPQRLNPKLYAMYLTVYDRAGNFRRARGFILVDVTSSIKTRDDLLFPLRVKSAEADTAYQWQRNLDPVTVAWQGRYYNDWYSHTDYLKPIKSDPEIENLYDQNTGNLSVSGTLNIEGIISYMYSVNRKSFSLNSGMFLSVSNIIAQELMVNNMEIPMDGDDIDIKIKVTDIIGNSITETVNVKVDSTPPAVRKIHFDNTTLSIEAYDNHSGMKELEWSITDTMTGVVVDTGIFTFYSFCATDEPCMCPFIGPCMVYVKTSNLGYIGPDKHSYLYEIKATNKAGLQTIREFVCSLICKKTFKEDSPRGATDITPPTHCFAGMESSTCTYMIDVGSRIRSSTQLTVIAKGWFDPDTMSDTVQPSGIDRYTLVIYDTIVENLFITVDKSAYVISEITSSTGQFSVSLPQQLTPKLYALYLTVYDRAGNFNKARLFILVDFTSNIQRRNSSAFPLRVTSAEADTNYHWQNKLYPTTVVWQGRYYNDWYEHTNYLKPIKSDPEIEHVFDQNSGDLSVSGTLNIDGIVSFMYFVNRKTFNWDTGMFLSVSNIIAQELMFNDMEIPIMDGDDIDIKIKVTDIMGNFITETVNVKVDSTPPAVRKIHFDNTTLTIEAYDNHGGMKELEWSITDTMTGIVVGTGIFSFHSYCTTDEPCMCPLIGPCMAYVKTSNLGNSGPDQHSYLYEIKATNKAGLHTIREFVCSLICNKTFNEDAPRNATEAFNGDAPRNTTGSDVWTAANIGYVAGGAATFVSVLGYIIYLVIKRKCFSDDENEALCSFIIHNTCCICKNVCNTHSHNGNSEAHTHGNAGWDSQGPRCLSSSGVICHVEGHFSRTLYENGEECGNNTFNYARNLGVHHGAPWKDGLPAIAD